MLAALASFALWGLPPAPSELAAQPALQAAVQPTAKPALYSVRDSDTLVYIFGTFHVLDPSIRWFEGEIEQAFDQSDQLVVETLPPSLAASAPRKRAPHAARPAFSEATPAASFLATSQAAVHAGQGEGMSLDHGADMVLLRSAAAWGKAIEPLETLQSQHAMLSKLPGNEAAPVDPATLAAIPASAEQAQANAADLARAMTQLQAAWAAGDQGVFAGMVSRMRDTSPGAYRVMFLERNARWTDWIAARMREPGTVFVAVGAGHLAGPDSLLVRLAQRGIISRRVSR